MRSTKNPANKNTKSIDKYLTKQNTCLAIYCSIYEKLRNTKYTGILLSPGIEYAKDV